MMSLLTVMPHGNNNNNNDMQCASFGRDIVIYSAIQCLQANQKQQNFLSPREKLTPVSEQALIFKYFLFLHGTSIFTGFGVMSYLTLFSFYRFHMLFAKNANHNIKTIDEQKFCKPVVSSGKVIDM